MRHRLSIFGFLMTALILCSSSLLEWNPTGRHSESDSLPFLPEEEEVVSDAEAELQKLRFNEVADFPQTEFTSFVEWHLLIVQEAHILPLFSHRVVDCRGPPPQGGVAGLFA